MSIVGGNPEVVLFGRHNMGQQGMIIEYYRTVEMVMGKYQPDRRNPWSRNGYSQATANQPFRSELTCTRP